MAKYIKLGSKAESFYDPYSELSLAGKDVAIFTPKMEASGRVTQGLKGGHLSISNEQEYNIFKGIEKEKVETIESKFGKTAEELVSYYQKTYETTPADIKKFKKKALEGMVKELTKLEEDNQ